MKFLSSAQRARVRLPQSHFADSKLPPTSTQSKHTTTTTTTKRSITRMQKVNNSKMDDLSMVDESDHEDENEDDDVEIESDSSASGSQNRSGKDKQSKDDKAVRDRIQPQENAVRNVRIILLLAIIVCTVSVSWAIYSFASKSDENSFELEYEGFVGDMSNLVHWEVQYNFALLSQLSASLTSTATIMGSTWPKFTHPHFEITGGYADGMGGIMVAGFAPLVQAVDREDWQDYAVKEQGWLQESARLKIVHPEHRDALHGTIQDHEHRRRMDDAASSYNISHEIFHWGPSGEKIPEPYVRRSDQTVYAPLWQSAPASAPVVNYNIFSEPRMVELYEAMIAKNRSVLSKATSINYTFDFLFEYEEQPLKANPHAIIMEPIYDAFDLDPNIVGVIVGVTSFGNLLDKILPVGSNGLIGIIKDSCGVELTYRIDGPISTFVGYGDLHDAEFNGYKRSTTMELYESEGIDGVCVHTLDLYPSQTFRDSYNTNNPKVYTSVVVAAFVITCLLLFIYDRPVRRRQQKTMETAMRTEKIVASLFPSTVRERVFKDAESDQEKSFLASKYMDDDENEVPLSRPIADFYPHTTVMFADISGFTAWSSTREPFQVFLLLETIYGAFDKLATRRRVFKVETVGDSYVAVCGAPEPRKDHAVVMARFASECLSKSREVTRNLEMSLGPDTSELKFRIGLHSGPVTGGVLRGNNARYQLFGDTVNVAARMESTGQKNRIQVSSQTASLLRSAGKRHWLTARGEAVHAKGKGEVETFWLNRDGDLETETTRSSSADDRSTNSEQVGSGETSTPVEEAPTYIAYGNPDSKTARLVEWNTAVLIERVKDIIRFREHGAMKRPIPISIPDNVATQLQRYVTGIASMYRNNPFHNFEHASHVTMSVTKLLSRVSSTDDRYAKDICENKLLQFSICFSALIHDVDHTGVPNATLVKEGVALAKMYDNKSVAEKNSLSLAWEFLLKPEFSDLVACICPTASELERFYDLMVMSVMATDIVDSDLKKDRNDRWDSVFAESSATGGNHLRTGIVLEHMIQASDICHTMQHWQVYRKWNERFFMECYKAYKEGRADKNPADYWYNGEIGFFDFYIIPLAKKLRDCGVFGVACDEYLDYATRNRAEWEAKGRDVVAAFVEKAEST